MPTHDDGRLLVRESDRVAWLRALSGDVESLPLTVVDDPVAESCPGDVVLVLDGSRIAAASCPEGVGRVVGAPSARIAELSELSELSEPAELLLLPATVDELRMRAARARREAGRRLETRDETDSREARLRFGVLRDEVTGLPNARLFADRLESELARCRRDGGGLVVAVLRVGSVVAGGGALDRRSADRLRGIGTRVRTALRGSDTVASRPGRRGATISRGAAPEFLLLLPVRRDAGAAHAALTRLLAEALDEGAEGEPRAVPDLALGYAMAPDQGFEADTLLRAARQAATDASAGEIRAALSLMGDNGGSTGPLAGTIEIWYQPIVDETGEQIFALEALARWRHPSLGLLGAGELLEAASTAGVRARVEAEILDAVCRQWRTWLDRGVGAVEIGLNLTGAELRDPGVAARLVAAVESSGVDPIFLRVEISEKDFRSGRAAVARFREAGIPVCIDDFGAGPTALSSLEEFRGEMVKLDRGLVRHLPEDASAIGRVRTILAMMSHAGAEAVAVGIESERQLRVLRTLGCERFQGFLLRAPQPASRIEALLRRGLVQQRQARVLPFRGAATGS